MAIIFLLIFLTTNLISLFAAPEVQLSNGVIRGRQSATYTGKTYYAFEKIPYAAPPIGELRFQAPVPPSNWDEPLEIDVLDVGCYQVGHNYDYESEDCLYLKVITPELPNESTASLPVMVFIYGGGFIGGTAIDIYGDRIVEEDIIFVAMNYRVGIFGFISTQDDVIPGNNGLKDQQLALRWVHDNIHLFGGDPNRVTIFGQSAGAASCGYQILNQANEGLFQGAILESGSFLSPWAYQRNAHDIAFTTAAFLNDTFKTNRDSKELLEFLMAADAQAIDDAATQYSLTYYRIRTAEIRNGFYWAPVVEEENPDAFLTEKMFGLLQAGKVVPVPILIGMNSEEGLPWAQSTDDLEYAMEQFDSNQDWLAPDDMGYPDYGNARYAMGMQIRDIYTNGESLASNLSNGVRYYSDTSFTRSIIKHAELYSPHAETYFYQFSYQGGLNQYGVYYEGAERVGHNQELHYLLCTGTACDLTNRAEADQITSKRLVKVWTNFAKYQNPTPEPDELLENIEWPVVDLSSGEFLYVNINQSLEIRNHPKEETYSKWNELYNTLDSTSFDTY